MKKSASFIIAKALLLALILSITDFTVLSQGVTNEKFPPVTVPNSEMRSFFSDILDQEVLLFIKLPPSYYSKPEKVYQGWYFTDANRSFPMVANFIDMFDATGSSESELLLIGIGYKVRDMAEWVSFRTRDLTPTNVPSVD